MGSIIARLVISAFLLFVACSEDDKSCNWNDQTYDHGDKWACECCTVSPTAGLDVASMCTCEDGAIKKQASSIDCGTSDIIVCPEYLPQ